MNTWPSPGPLGDKTLNNIFALVALSEYVKGECENFHLFFS
jgi:hypothetical protein